jgi:hypothetical protein
VRGEGGRIVHLHEEVRKRRRKAILEKREGQLALAAKGGASFLLTEGMDSKAKNNRFCRKVQC